MAKMRWDHAKRDRAPALTRRKGFVQTIRKPGPKPEYKDMFSLYDGHCNECFHQFPKGTLIRYEFISRKAYHVSCYKHLSGAKSL